MTPQEFNTALGAAIRKERKLRGWSMGVVGEKFGVSYQQIGKYELGENGCSAHMLTRFAEIFEISAVELLEKARINAAVIPRQPNPAECDATLAARYVAKIQSAALRRNIVDFARKCAYEEPAA